MTKSMVEDIQVARVILSLGHLYLQEHSLENLEDGQSPSNASSAPLHPTTMVDRSPNSSVHVLQYCYSDILSSNVLFNASTDSPNIIPTSMFSPSTNTGSHHFTHLSHNSNNILPSCHCIHSPCSDIFSSFRLCPSSGGKEGKCDPRHNLRTPTKESEKSEVQMEFNKNLQYNIEPEKHSQLYAETQHLNDKILNVFDCKKQQNHEAYIELKLDIQMQIDSENQKELDESMQKKLEEKQQMTCEKYVELILKIEMQQEFDEKLLTHQIDEEKQNMCKSNVQKIFTNEIINVKKPGQVDDETCVVKQVVTSDNENLPEFEQEVQQIDETEIEKLKQKIQDIKEIITGVLNFKQTTDRQMKHSLNGDSQVELINKINQEYKELQREIEEIYSKNYVYLEGVIIKNIDKMYIYSIHVKFLENLIILLHQESIPFFGRIKQLCNLYFQEKFNTKLDLKECEITQQESNENTQKVNAKQHLVKENTVSIVKERNIFNFFVENGVELGSLKTFEEKNKAIRSNSEDSKKEINDFVDNIQINNELQEESEMEIKDFENDVQVHNEVQEKSDVEIKDFNDGIRVCGEVQEESGVEIENVEDKIHYEYGKNINQLKKLTDEDARIIDKYIVKSISSSNEFISTEDNSNFTGKKFSSYSEEEFNKTTRPQLLTHAFEGVSKEKIEEVTKQKHLGDKLQRQLMIFQKELLKKLKLKYDEECKSKVNNNCNSLLSQVFDEQQQIFFILKDEFQKIKQQYKSFEQQQIFKELQKKIDEKLLNEIKVFPEKSDDEPNIKINEDLQNEYVNLEQNLYELEPEFLYNVPFEFEEDHPSQRSLQQKPYNLFEKLKCIHKQKLCDFSSSIQWPEQCLHPSSLLDSFFEDAREVKPNVLLITLFSIDIGYSISITTKINEPRTEIFFRYAEDTILKYVENEQIPQHLLDFLDKAKPTLFYCGCIIAEIHDQINGAPGKLYRILLRPTYMSVMSDLNRIMAENSHVNWTYKKKLKLESILLLASRPVMCMDSSPIAGLAVHLQHQVLSYRKIKLNPLNMKNKSENNIVKCNVNMLNHQL